MTQWLKRASACVVDCKQTWNSLVNPLGHSHTNVLTVFRVRARKLSVWWNWKCWKLVVQKSNYRFSVRINEKKHGIAIQPVFSKSIISDVKENSNIQLKIVKRKFYLHLIDIFECFPALVEMSTGLLCAGFLLHHVHFDQSHSLDSFRFRFQTLFHVPSSASLL